MIPEITSFTFRYALSIPGILAHKAPATPPAKVAKSQKELWNRNLVEFLRKRDNIRLFVHLVDSRHTDLEIDENLVCFISQFLRADQHLMRIFTKFDKLNATEQNRLKTAFPKALFSSSLKRQDQDKIVDSIIANALGQEVLEDL